MGDVHFGLVCGLECAEVKEVAVEEVFGEDIREGRKNTIGASRISLFPVLQMMPQGKFFGNLISFKHVISPNDIL